MKIILDFDDTLFDTRRFKQALISLFLQQGITAEQFQLTYYLHGQAAGSQLYDPYRQLKALAEYNEVSFERLKESLHNFMTDISGYVFSDVLPFLAQFRREDLFLVSYGQAEFLQKKVSGSKIDRFFCEAHFVTGQKGTAIETIMQRHGSAYEQWVFIDDRLDQILSVRAYLPMITTIQMIRPNSRYPQTAASCTTASDCSEICRIIQCLTDKTGERVDCNK